MPAFGYGQAAAPRNAPIFRYISIQPFGEIWLGQPFQQAAALGAPVHDRLFRLVEPGGRAAQFADLQAGILVELDASNNVRALFFSTFLAAERISHNERKSTRNRRASSEGCLPDLAGAGMSGLHGVMRRLPSSSFKLPTAWGRAC